RPASICTRGTKRTLIALDDGRTKFMNDEAVAYGPGTVLDEKYRLTRLLGGGGMSSVYEAERLHIGDKAAVKLLQKEFARDPVKKRRFQLEAYTTAAVKHPNVVSVLDYDETPEAEPYLVLELLNGPTLTSQIKHGRTMRAARVADIVTPVCAALNI